MNPSITIREATIDDAVAIAEQRMEYFVEEVGRRPDIQDFVPRMTNVVRKSIESGDSVVWIAEDNGLLVSITWVKIMVKVPWPDPFNARWAYVTNVYSRPTHRGLGIGTRLMKLLQEWATEQGFEFLILWPSEKSVAWYRRLGFREDPEVLVWTPQDR